MKRVAAEKITDELSRYAVQGRPNELEVCELKDTLRGSTGETYG